MKYIKIFEDFTKDDVSMYFVDFTDSGWDINISKMRKDDEWSIRTYSENAYHITLSYHSETPPNRQDITNKINETIPILEEVALRLSDDGNTFGRINLGISINKRGVGCHRDYDFKLKDGDIVMTKTFDLEKFYKESIDHWECTSWYLSILCCINY